MIFKFNLILFYFNITLKNIYLDLQFPKTCNAFIDNQGFYHFLTEISPDQRSMNPFKPLDLMNMNFEDLAQQNAQG